MHVSRPTHFEATHRLRRYLKGTPGKEEIFKKYDHLHGEIYTDVDWEVVSQDTVRRSTSGYCSFVGGNLNTWRSKKKKWWLEVVRCIIQGFSPQHLWGYMDKETIVRIEILQNDAHVYLLWQQNNHLHFS